MQHSRLAAPTFLLLCAALVAIPLEGQEPVLSSRSRYATDSGGTQRVLLDSGSTRVFAAVGRGPGEDFASLGLSTPQLVAGPVTMHGLIREMNHPTRYTPDSTVYREGTGLALETAMEPVIRYGLQVQPWAAVPALFLVMREQRPELVGAHSSLTKGAVTLAGAVIRAFPDTERPDEGWYTEYPRYPGGVVEQAALEVTVRGGRSLASAAAFLSGGALVAAAPGTRLRVEHRGALVRAAVSGSWVGAEYPQTEGRFSRDERYTGGTVRVGRTRGPYAQASAGERVGSAPLRDGRVGAIRRDLQLAAGVAEHPVGPVRLSAGVVGEWVPARDDRGRWTRTRTVAATGGVRVGAARARLRLERREWSEERDSGELVLGYRGRVLYGEARLLVESSAGAAPEYGGRLEVGARRSGFDLSGSLATMEHITAAEMLDENRIPLRFSLTLTTRHRPSRPRAEPPAPDGSQTR